MSSYRDVAYGPSKAVPTIGLQAPLPLLSLRTMHALSVLFALGSRATTLLISLPKTTGLNKAPPLLTTRVRRLLPRLTTRKQASNCRVDSS